VSFPDPVGGSSVGFALGAGGLFEEQDAGEFAAVEDGADPVGSAAVASGLEVVVELVGELGCGVSDVADGLSVGFGEGVDADGFHWGCPQVGVALVR
jgi:hypothetical protein